MAEATAKFGRMSKCSCRQEETEIGGTSEEVDKSQMAVLAIFSSGVQLIDGREDGNLSTSMFHDANPDEVSSCSPSIIDVSTSVNQSLLIVP